MRATKIIVSFSFDPNSNWIFLGISLHICKKKVITSDYSSLIFKSEDINQVEDNNYWQIK